MRHFKIKGIIVIGSFILALVGMLILTGCPQFPFDGSADGASDVTYDANGADRGSVSADGTNYGEADTVTVKGPSDLSRGTCDYVNWNTARDGSDTSPYSQGDTSTITEDVSLYAQWSLDYFRLYSPAGAGLAGVYQSSSSFAHVDPAGDTVFLITVRDESNNYLATLYLVGL
jgi:hypothetical protein